MTNRLHSINSALDTAGEKKVIKFEDVAVEAIQNKTEGG